MYLFFDTETTGLPNNWSAPVSDTTNWPRMVQLALLLCNSDGKEIESQNFIIKPNGYTIPLAASAIHGITTERANSEGVELTSVLTSFKKSMGMSTALVAHNMDFDEKILGCEYFRTISADPLKGTQKFCTMKSPAIISYCALPPYRYGSYKWPKLSELHEKLFGTEFEEAHNAKADMQATSRCFFELRRQKII